MTSREISKAAIFFVALIFLFFGDTLFTSLTYFAGDITYYWLPRKTHIAQCLQCGHFPLWNPYFRCGLPFFANPDNSVLDIFSLVFNFLSFACALKLFQILSFFAACMGCFTLGRFFKWKNVTAVFFGTVFVFGGYFLVRSQFISQCSTLVWGIWSAIFLFSGQFYIAALPLALMVYAGHWQTAAIFMSIVFASAAAGRASFDKITARNTIMPLLLISGLCAAQIFPALELARNSFWGREGLPLANSTVYSLSFRDLGNFAFNHFAPEKNSNVDNSFWVEYLQIGVVPVILSFCGFVLVSARRKIFFAALILLSVILSLGSGNPVSLFFHRHLYFLSYIRYPERWILGCYCALIILAAAAFDRLRIGVKYILLTAVFLQLFAAWHGSSALISGSFFRGRGELARYLQTHLEKDKRFFLSFRAERLLKGFGGDYSGQAQDLRDRLYIYSPLLFGLPQAGGYGEPLTIKRFDDFLETVGRQKSPDDAERYLSRMGVSHILSPDAWQDTRYRLESAPKWFTYVNLKALPRAYWAGQEEFLGTQSAGSERKNICKIDAVFGDEKIFAAGGVAGKGGYAAISDVFYPGWEAYVNGKKTGIIADGGVFRAVPVPDKFSIYVLYRPKLFYWGLVFAALSAVWMIFRLLRYGRYGFL